MNDVEKKKQCEEESCTDEATCFVRDVKEVIPKPGCYRSFEPDGIFHGWCKKHEKESELKALLY